MSDIILENNDMCFGCGKNNKCGLKLVPEYKEDHTECEIIFEEIYQGWKNIVHGGIISTVMDETMFFEMQRNKHYGVTYLINVKFKKPAIVGEKYVCKAYLKKEKGHLIYLNSILTNSKNEKIAIAKATFYKIYENYSIADKKS